MSVSEIQVHMLPLLIPPQGLVGGVAVVIDVLRASTTILHALGNGANKVIPTETVEEAREIARRTSEKVLLGGERHCQLIEGFDLDNSPRSYTSDKVKDRTIVFTTTNGTKALKAAAEAEVVFIGAFANLKALVARLQTESRTIHLICAGTNGQVTAEDVLFAGAVIERMRQERPAPSVEPVQTQLALDFYKARVQSGRPLLETMQQSLGGRNLVALGMAEDISLALEDRFDFVPVWSKTTGEITQ